MNPKRIIPGQSDQGVLFSAHYIGDRLSQDHEVFEFREILNKMILSSIVESYGDEGGKMYSPRDLFAIVCYGYHKRMVSSYQMADAVENRLDFIYLAPFCNYEASDQTPDDLRISSSPWKGYKTITCPEYQTC
jgi:transposase